jgi:hypothetical protein
MFLSYPNVWTCELQWCHLEDGLSIAIVLFSGVFGVGMGTHDSPRVLPILNCTPLLESTLKRCSLPDP